MAFNKNRQIRTVSGEWECDECGYVRRGTLRNRPKRCPICNAPADAFTFWSDDDEYDEYIEEDDDDWEDDLDDLDWNEDF